MKNPPENYCVIAKDWFEGEWYVVSDTLFGVHITRTDAEFIRRKVDRGNKDRGTLVVPVASLPDYKTTLGTFSVLAWDTDGKKWYRLSNHLEEWGEVHEFSAIDANAVMEMFKLSCSGTYTAATVVVPSSNILKDYGVEE